MIRYIFLAVLFLTSQVKAIDYFDLYEKAKSDDKDAITTLINHCFDVDTINKQVSWVFKTTVYGLDEEKETCRWDLVDNWIDFAIEDGHSIAYYYKALRTQFDYDENYLYYLKIAAQNGLDAAYIDLAEHFERHKEFNESGVEYIKKAIEININRNEKNNNLSYYNSLYRTYSFGNIERKNTQEAYNIKKKIREEIHNGNYPDYFTAVLSNFFGIEGKIDYKKSLKFIQESPVTTNNSSENIEGIKKIEALHYLYGLGVDKDIEEAFLILNDVYDENDSLLNLLLILCLEEMPSLDIFGNKSKYQKRLYNGANIYNKQILELENIDRNVDIELGLISFSAEDYVGVEKYFSKAIKNDETGVAAYIFAKELLLGGYAMPNKIIKLLEKSTFKKHYGAMNELALMYSVYSKKINESKIGIIENLFKESIDNKDHISNSLRNSYFNYCSSIYFSNNILNISEVSMEDICFKIIDEEYFESFGIDAFTLNRIGYTFREHHSDINTRLLYNCLGQAPLREDLENYENFDLLRVKLNKKLYDLFQNGSLVALEKLFNLNLGNNRCFEGEINKGDAAMFYYAYMILLNEYEEAGYVYWSSQDIKGRNLSELNLSDNDLDKAKERAKNLIKLVDLDKIN